MMELGATVCLPRNPQCLACPIAEFCKTRGEHKTVARLRSVIREAGYALCLRQEHNGASADQDPAQVLLEQRPPTVSVMPGLWELPALLEVPNGNTRITVRHAIMNVNYIVRIRDAQEDELADVAASGGVRRWVPLRDAEGTRRQSRRLARAGAEGVRSEADCVAVRAADRARHHEWQGQYL